MLFFCKIEGKIKAREGSDGPPLCWFLEDAGRDNNTFVSVPSPTKKTPHNLGKTRSLSQLGIARYWYILVPHAALSQIFHCSPQYFSSQNGNPITTVGWHKITYARPLIGIRFGTGVLVRSLCFAFLPLEFAPVPPPLPHNPADKLP